MERTLKQLETTLSKIEGAKLDKPIEEYTLTDVFKVFNFLINVYRLTAFVNTAGEIELEHDTFGTYILQWDLESVYLKEQDVNLVIDLDNILDNFID